MTTVNSPFSYYSIKVTSQLVKHVHPNMGQVFKSGPSKICGRQ